VCRGAILPPTDQRLREPGIERQLEEVLRTDRLIDITTTGSRSGELRRIEIGFFNVEGRIFITGRPGPRGW
jgi:hypothetical protein